MLLIIIVLILAVAMSGGLGYYFLSRDEGPAEPIWALVSVFAIGLAAAQLAGIVNDNLIPYAVDGSAGLMGAVVIGIVPGIFEELLKGLPVTFFVSSQTFFRKGTDGVIYFAFSGLAFGLLENIQYTLQQGPQVGFDRLLTLLFFHAATSGVFGWYFYRAKFFGEWRRAIFVAAILMLTHGLYNFGTVFIGAIPVLRFVTYGIAVGLTVWLIRTFQAARKTDRQAS